MFRYFPTNYVWNLSVDPYKGSSASNVAVAGNEVLFNMAGSPLCTLTGRDVRVIAEDAALAGVFEDLVHEGLSIAASDGVHFGDGEVDVPAMRPGDGSSHKPSMLQDFERGRPLEIDAILRAPQRLARAAGLDTPVLDTVIALLDRRLADR